MHAHSIVGTASAGHFRAASRTHQHRFCAKRLLRASPLLQGLQRNENMVCGVTLKIKDYEGAPEAFSLQPEAAAALEKVLTSPAFCELVRTETKKFPETTKLQFTGKLFQPVPWSPSTRRGMPASMEQYHDSPTHAIINIPPTVMFKAKVFGPGNPGRLCAVYEVVQTAE